VHRFFAEPVLDFMPRFVFGFGRMDQIVDGALFAIRGRGGIHPATRTFQALRVSVNQELEGLHTALAACPELLNEGGRLGVISYHSGEDRIAKRAFARFARTLGWQLITRRVVTPSEEEVRRNPRARSAKLRVIKKS